MRASLAETHVARLDVGRVDVGELRAGPLRVGRLVLEGGRLQMSSGAVRLRALRVTVGLRMVLDWRVSVSILGFPKRWEGSIDLKDHELTVGLGDLDLPGLATSTLDLPSVTADDVSAVMEPLRDLRLGPLLVEQVQARDVVAPVPDLTLTGLGLGRVAVTGLAVPGATAASAHLGRVRGEGLPLGTVTLPPVVFPEAAVGDLRAADVTTSGVSNPIELVADAGVLRATLRIVPRARMQADELAITGLRSSAALDRVVLTDVELPYEVLDVTLGEIGINGVEVPTVEVS